MAYAAARASEDEGQPTFVRARELVGAWMEWTSVLLLCDGYDRGAELDMALEETMRAAMTRPMGFDGWRLVFEALLRSSRVRAIVGVDPGNELPPDHPVAAAIWAATGDVDERVDLIGFCRAMSDPGNFRDDAAPAILTAVRALIEGSPALSTFTLYRILGIEGVPTGGFRVRHRRFRGTSWPAPTFTDVKTPPRFRSGDLVFWDGAERRVAVPEWLVHVDPTSLEVGLYDGRDPETRQWRYRRARPGLRVLTLPRLPATAPVVLAEPTWRTPAPASRRATPEPVTLRQTLSPTLAAGATSADAKDPITEDFKGPARYLLTVLAGRSYLRFCELSDEDSVVLGRNPAFASFVIHHHEVSRSNTRVWTSTNGDLYVQDLRSTNGTQLNGEPVGNAPERVKVGDVISVGPVPVGVSWWTEDEANRLRRLVVSTDDRDRDPLTGLYTPAWLNDGPERAAGGFGGEDLAALYVLVDRLGAMHAQHGAEVADTVFQNVARALMSRLAAPGAAVRVGYGEILAIVPSGGLAAAEALGDQLLEWVTDHRWLPRADKIALRAVAVSRRSSESVDAWLARARATLGENRAAGLGQVSSERS